MSIYLDHNATTPTDPTVVSGMSAVMTYGWGNPSTLYSTGRRAKEVLDEARSRVARFLEARDPSEVVFTSGGTEGNNLAVIGACRALAGKGNHVVTTMAEHASVLRACGALQEESFQVTYLPSTARGGSIPPRFGGPSGGRRSSSP